MAGPVNYTKWLAAISFASGIAVFLGTHFLVAGQWWWSVGYSVAIIMMLTTAHDCYQRLRSDEIAAQLGGPILTEMSRDPDAAITVRRVAHDDGPHWQVTITHPRPTEDR